MIASPKIFSRGLGASAECAEKQEPAEDETQKTEDELQFVPG